MSTFSRIARVFIGLALTALLPYSWKYLFFASGFYGLAVFMVTTTAFVIGGIILYNTSRAKAIESSDYPDVTQEDGEKSSLLKQQEEESTDGVVSSVSAAEVVSDHPLDSKSQLGAIFYILTSPQFWVVSFAQCTYYAIFELPTYLPIYLNEVKHLSDTDAGRASLAFSLGPALTIFIAGNLYDLLKYFKLGRIIFIAIVQIAVCLCAAALWVLPALHISITITLLFVLAAGASPGFYIAYSVFSAQFGGTKHTAKVNSFVSAIASLFEIGFVYAMGYISEYWGWNIFWLVMLIMCVLSAVFAILYEVMALGVQLLNRKKVNA